MTDVPRASPETTAATARALIGNGRYTAVGDVAVVDGEQFLGAVSSEVLLASPPSRPLSALASWPIVVAPGDDLEGAAHRVAQEGGRVVAVVDDGGRLHGFVPPETLLLVLELEHEEDLARLGGFISRASSARLASEETVPRRLWHRLPWLALGLAGAMSSALIVASFEEELRTEVLLTFFLPAVVYMADAVGTQTEAIVIRGMAVGVPVGRVLARELLTGVVIGVLVGFAFFPFVLAVWDDGRVAASVAIALFVSCSVATIVAMALPAALAHFGRDPAFGSGPLATVIQDLLSIAAYFAVALAIAF